MTKKKKAVRSVGKSHPGKGAPPSMHWLTRGIEFLMIFSSLFWAIEVRATQTKPNKAGTPRKPSSYSAESFRAKPLMKLGPDYELSNRIQKKARVTSTHSSSMRSQKVASGTDSPKSFQTTTTEAAPIVEVFRFPTPR